MKNSRLNQIQMTRYILPGLLVLFALNQSCSVAQKATQKMTSGIAHYFDDLGRVPREAPADFKKALTDLQARKFAEALEGFDSYIQREPVSPWTLSALLNSGRALEGLERWSEAETRFRSVILNSQQTPKLQAISLYRLSFVHEALDRDQEAVAVLHDLLNRKSHLPSEIAEAELPARLAAAYARVGNFAQAIVYYDMAEGGIQKLQRMSGGSFPQWLPSTLYFMGTMANQRPSWVTFESAIRPLPRGQVYLLKASEMGVSPWSDYSADDLISIYNSLWKVIEAPPVIASDDPVVSLRETQRIQVDYLSILLETLYSLRARFIVADKNVSPQAQKIINYVDDLEGKIQALLAKRPTGEGLTVESLRRRSEVRGNVLAPDTKLEVFFKQNEKNLKAKAAEQPPKVLPEKKGTPTVVPEVETPPVAPAATVPEVVISPTPTPLPDVPAPVQAAPPKANSEDPNL